MIPNGWTEEELQDFMEYLSEMSDEELQFELKLIESLGEAKKMGKNIVFNDSIYEM